MTFQEFLNRIVGIFTSFINWGGTILNSLMNNYIFMIIIYMGITILIIGTILDIVNIIKDKTSKNVKDKGN